MKLRNLANRFFHGLQLGALALTGCAFPHVSWREDRPPPVPPATVTQVQGTLMPKPGKTVGPATASGEVTVSIQDLPETFPQNRTGSEKQGIRLERASGITQAYASQTPPPLVQMEVPRPVTTNAPPKAGDVLLVDFSALLGMAPGNNLQIALAQERIQEAYADELAANLLWLPSLRVGMTYNHHEGTLQETGGRVFDVSRSSLIAGGGVMAVGAGTPMLPGVSLNVPLGDVFFQPRIAEAISRAREASASVATNETLLQVAQGYLDLLSAFQEKAIAVEIAGKAEQLAKLTASFARTGQGSRADADRAQTELTLRKNAIDLAEERARVASARLAEILRLAPELKLMPKEAHLVPLELAPVQLPLRELIALALSNRPELVENRELVHEAVLRLRREKVSPFVPSVLLGMSYGGFGGGSGRSLDSYKDRFDLDAGLFWEVRNLGWGEHAARRRAVSRLEQSQIRELQQMDRVAREVNEAKARVTLRKRQIAVAQQGTRVAQDALRRDLGRIREGQGLPIEALQSLRALDQAHREVLRTIISYNRAQFELHWSLGWPGTDTHCSK